MSIPAVLGAAVLELKDIGTEVISGGMVTNCVAGAIVSGVVGYICIRTMLVVVRKKNFKGFSIYCFAAGPCDHRPFYRIEIVRGDIHGSKERDRKPENDRQKADGVQDGRLLLRRGELPVLPLPGEMERDSRKRRRVSSAFLLHRR